MALADKRDLGKGKRSPLEKNHLPMSPIDDMFHKPVKTADGVWTKRNPAKREYNHGAHRTGVHTVAQGFGEY